MSKKDLQEKSWLRRNSGAVIATTIAIASLIISGISLYHEFYPPPQRAKLTIFIEHYSITTGSANELNFDIWGKIVNDGPLTGSVKEWDLFVGLNLSYKTLNSKFDYDPKDLTISPSKHINFTMGKTLIGENGTRLPENAIKSCVVTIWYKDDIGYQVAKEELGFI